MARRWRLAMPAVLGVIATVIVSLPGMALNLHDSSLRADGRRLMPELEIVPAVSMGLAVGTVALFVLLMVRRGWPAARDRRTAFKVFYVGGSVAAQIGAILSSLLLLTFSNFHLFDDSYAGVKARSPEHGVTVYLYTDGWLCEHPVYVRRDGELALRKVGEIDGICDRAPDGRRIRFEGRIAVLDSSDGRALGRVSLDPVVPSGP